MMPPRPRPVRVLILAGLLVLTGGTGCGAPQARRAGGEVAQAMSAALASGSERFDSDDWGRLLAGGTRDGLVDYDFMRRHRSQLDAYLERVAAAPLARLARGQLLALLANAYNACTIRSILDHPGVGSIKEIPDVWTGTRHRVGGFDLTLDDIEHRLLRPFFKDPRIHFALNCASRSCAPLPPWALDGDRVEAQMEERARVFLSDRRNARVEGGMLLLSRYFDWYGSDFTTEGWVGAAPTVAAYVARYARPEVAALVATHHGSPPLRFLDYDWSLNAAAPAGGGGATVLSPAGPGRR
jgi:Protein of unknown function, DUF547